MNPNPNMNINTIANEAMDNFDRAIKLAWSAYADLRDVGLTQEEVATLGDALGKLHKAKREATHYLRHRHCIYVPS